MKWTFRRIAISFWFVLSFGLALAATARAAGPGPGPGGGLPIHLSLGPITLDQDHEVVITGYLTCDVPADVTLSAVVTQTHGHRQASGANAEEFACPGPAGTGVSLPVTADRIPHFVPGTMQIQLELEGCTLPDDNGQFNCVDQFGIITQDVPRS